MSRPIIFNIEADELWVDTEFKLKYHNEFLEKKIIFDTVRKHNEMVLLIDKILNEIKSLKQKL